MGSRNLGKYLKMSFLLCGFMRCLMQTQVIRNKFFCANPLSFSLVSHLHCGSPTMCKDRHNGLWWVCVVKWVTRLSPRAATFRTSHCAPLLKHVLCGIATFHFLGNFQTYVDEIPKARSEFQFSGFAVFF